MKPLKLEFDWCDIKLHSELSMSGGVSFCLTNKGDMDGNILPKDNQTTYHYELDNYQAYQLALSILSTIDVRDTRGSR